MRAVRTTLYRGLDMVAVAVVAVAVLIALTACTTEGSEQARSADTLRQESITLQDGRTVQCIVYASGYKGGLSCDWESA